MLLLRFRLSRKFKKVGDWLDNPDPSRLTPQERQVASLVRRGLRDNEIASMMSMDIHTVKGLINAVYAKTGVSDRLELAFYAHRHRI